ncbi:unnamed protein product [Calicophoron daubneyi]|uniref:Annexin n=1 Tax=Calicophoron daubneyi TaxID=300641 RepID=A0AAV2TLW5_CALDB
MPVTGGIEAPVITPLKAFNKGDSKSGIDTGTFIEIKSETPNARIYFTTDGSNPNPWKPDKHRHKTFPYKAPFALRAGRRVVKAMAVHPVTQVESHVVTRNFAVSELDEPGSSGGDLYEDDTSSPDTNVYEEGGRSSRAIVKKREQEILDDTVDDFLRKSADQGFAATNHSGTQINLWGQVPGLNWDVRTPNSGNIYGSYANPTGTPFTSTTFPPHPIPMENSVTPQQLASIATQLTQCIDQTRHMTIAEVRESLKQLESKLPALEAAKPTPALMAVSQGGGNVENQLDHIRRHLLEYTRLDSDLAVAIGDARIGKVISADFDEDESSFLLTVQLEKPGANRRRRPPRYVDEPRPSRARRPESALSDAEQSSRHSSGKPERREPVRPKRTSDIRRPEEPKPEKRNSKTPTVSEQKRQSLSKPEVIASDPNSRAGDGEDYKEYSAVEDVFSPTLKPEPNFDANMDCERLRKAMKGMGTDEKTIIEIMGHRSADQRVQIVQQYKTMYGRDLVKDFRSEISGHFQAVIEALCYGPAQVDAFLIRNAVKGAGTDEECLIDILCTRNNEQIRKMKEAYSQMFEGRNMEKDIVGDTSRHFKRIMVSMLQANRDESTTVDMEKVKRDVDDLYRAGENKLGTEESTFNMILAQRSFPHLRALFEEYMKVSKHDIETALKKELSGSIQKSMLAVVRCIKNKPKYFADQLMESMKGAGTKDTALIRIVVTRCEVDMGKIKEEFQRAYGKTLETWIADDTTGDYRKILQALVGG